MKFYISFGQAHVHKFGSKILSSNTLLQIDVDSEDIAMEVANKLFGNKWSMLYTEDSVSFEYFKEVVVHNVPHWYKSKDTKTVEKEQLDVFKEKLKKFEEGEIDKFEFQKAFKDFISFTKNEIDPFVRE